MPYPDLMNVLAETESGAVAMSCHSWATRFADTRIELYGSEGTVVYHLRGDVLEGARVGDAGLQRLTIPPEHDGTWRIEEEFVALVRGEVAEPSFTFADGVRNMAYLEAAYRSATEGGWVPVA